MDKEIKLGTVVKLKSGGLEMTVIEKGDSIAKCSWFDKGEPQFQNYPYVALVISDNEE